MTKHVATPDPWIRHRNPITHDIHIKAQTEVVMTVHHLGNDREHEQAANAALVTASHSMLMGLKCVRDQMRYALAHPNECEHILETMRDFTNTLIDLAEPPRPTRRTTPPRPRTHRPRRR